MADYGIDISKYQKGISFKKVSQLCDFAIIRCGITDTTTSKKTPCKDSSFEYFYKQAKQYNIPIGAYYYSRATSAAEGLEEAKFVYENCLRGHKFEYPIYIDVEDEVQKGNKAGVTDAILAFCTYLESKKYMCGIYASLVSGFQNMMYVNKLSGYTKWVAAWQETKPNTNMAHFDMWQFSSNKKIDNITIDSNWCYRDFPTLIKKNGLNGYSGSSQSDKITIDGIFGTETITAMQKWLIKKPYNKGIKETDGRILAQPVDNRKYIPSAKSGWIWQNNYNGYDATIATLQQYLKYNSCSPGLVDGQIGYKTCYSLQNLLKKRGYYNGALDGIFGNASTTAFQIWLNS